MYGSPPDQMDTEGHTGMYKIQKQANIEMFYLEEKYVNFFGKNMNPKITLLCKSVWYYSLIDEDMFFTWIEKIPAIVKYDGKLDELYLYVKSKKIKNIDLIELIGLFYRYKLD